MLQRLIRGWNRPDCLEVARPGFEPGSQAVVATHSLQRPICLAATPPGYTGYRDSFNSDANLVFRGEIHQKVGYPLRRVLHPIEQLLRLSRKPWAVALREKPLDKPRDRFCVPASRQQALRGQVPLRVQVSLERRDSWDALQRRLHTHRATHADEDIADLQKSCPVDDLIRDDESLSVLLLDRLELVLIPA